MPNHVTSKLKISGPQEHLRQFADQVKGAAVGGENSLFTLHRVIPQPEILSRVEDSSSASFGLWLVDEELHKKLILDDPINQRINETLKLPDRGMAERFSQYVRNTCGSREEAQAWATANRPELFTLGKIMAEAYRSCGYHSWYGWRIANWGTKWDTYNVTLESDPGQLIYMFDTAWSPPYQVIEALAEKFPALILEHKYFDELSNFWGIHLYRDGKLAENRENLEENHADLCYELFGYDPNEGDENNETTPA